MEVSHLYDGLILKCLLRKEFKALEEKVMITFRKQWS